MIGVSVTTCPTIQLSPSGSDALSLCALDLSSNNASAWLFDNHTAVLLAIVLIPSLAYACWMRIRGNQQKQADRATSASPSAILENAQESDAWNAMACGQASIDLIDGLQDKLMSAIGKSDDTESRWLFNSIPDGLCLSDRHGKISRVNQSLTAILGIERPIVDTSIAELLVEAATSGVDDLVDRVERGSSSYTGELMQGAELDDGVLRVSFSPLLDDDGGERGLIWSVRDITQQKLAEEMRNQFVFTATHELRTPLTNLKAYAETLAVSEGIDVEKQKQFCNIINVEATRLSRFVDDLLDVSQMEGGALSVNRSPLDLERILNEVIENVQPDIERHAQEFEYIPAPKLPKMTGDRDKLASALVNLLGNASKYTPDAGSIRMQVEVDEQTLQIHVQDTGYGITPAEQTRIFEKFFRSDDGRVRELTGNGLGLAFTQEVARLHGGNVSVTSEIDRGSRFTLSLPIR